MNVLFLTFGRIEDINDRTIYCDLLREFLKQGNKICVLSPGSQDGISGENYRLEYVNLDTVRGGSNLIKKGLSTIMVKRKYINEIKKVYQSVRFDLVLYSTPPITLFKVVEYVKKRDKAQTYLLLKDIFPQNAIDIGLMGTKGLKGLIYKHFRRQEKRLYKISDMIGCMSQANLDYVIEHNPEVDPGKVEICPNSIEITDKSVNDETRKRIRTKYDIPLNRKVFVYGGNLGKPQGIPFIIECMRASKEIEEVYFLIVGDGTEYRKLENYVSTGQQKNLKLMKRMPKEDYDTLVAACDVGLIFLDHRFTIPNFPSRLLGYLAAKLPVLACTDPKTDLGQVIKAGEFGWWCESDNIDIFVEKVEEIINTDTSQLGLNGYSYLVEHYSASVSYGIIMNSLKNMARQKLNEAYNS